MEPTVPINISFRSRVLSIQSHVVHGCVGNSAACFPMQINGVDVDSFNILSFSNHTGYKVSKGYRVSPDQFQLIAEGLTHNKFIYGYNYILSGYVGNPLVMEEIAAFIRSIKGSTSVANSGNLVPPLYVCDPVCGDLGQLYVSQECVDVYRSALLPLAQLALPNGFEASVISGINVISLSSAMEAADWFHTVPRVGTVVIKSFRDKDRDPDESLIFMLVSEADYDTDGINIRSTKRSLIAVPYVAGYFTGTGDAFGGLFMAHYARAQFAKRQCDEGKTGTYRTVSECVAAAATATLGVLRRTQSYRLATNDGSTKDVERGQSDSSDFDSRELMLIHSADVLRSDFIDVKIETL